MTNKINFPKSVRVNRFIYDVYTRNEYGDKEVILVPRTNGDNAHSNISYDDYAFTHGGNTFKDAVRKAKELAKNLDNAPARNILETMQF